jgi:hypothetical protein
MVLIAALPVPILMWGAALIILTMMLFASGDICDASGGCSGPAVAAAVTTVVGTIMYALGAIFALVGVHLKRRPPKEKLDDIFR